MGLSYARHPIRVLGVDPGLTRCGVGVVEGAPGRALTLVAVGVIRTSADEDIAARLLAIETEIEEPGWTRAGPTRSPSSGCSASTTCAR